MRITFGLTMSIRHLSVPLAAREVNTRSVLKFVRAPMPVLPSSALTKQLHHVLTLGGIRTSTVIQARELSRRERTAANSHPPAEWMICSSRDSLPLRACESATGAVRIEGRLGWCEVNHQSTWNDAVLADSRHLICARAQRDGNGTKCTFPRNFCDRSGNFGIILRGEAV
jgi:hypothetical protein